ncbi:MAG: CHASE2 domain-containing protein [Proteobacteria bacterium]|nr:CHASE2 domain-containing protein [Pseudomonadota bacterium]
MKKASRSVGLVNIPYDPDGIVRHYFRYFVFNKDTLYSIAYSAFCNIQKNENKKNENLFYVIPPGAHGFFPTYSFWSVIDDSSFQIPETDVSFDVDAFYEYLNDGVFKNKIVFVGSSLMELHDYVPCYYQTINRSKGLISGVEYHASALLNLLYNRHIFSVNIILRLLIMILLGSIVIKYFEKKNILLGSLTFVAMLTLSFILSFYAFVQLRSNLFPVEIGVFLISVYLFNVIFLAFELRKERMEIKRLFQYYVSKDVVNKLIKQPELIHLSGEMKILTVLFTDIEGFTTISEHLKPTLVTEMLNEYLSIVTDIIIKNGGMIDKYEGDAVMAVFGAPIELENHAYSAVRAGINIVSAQDKVDELSKRFSIPKIKTRVGINSGEMLLGNLGTKSRLNYTVMGDSVNLGSRLESINKFYKTYLMCSEVTAKLIGDKISFRFIDKIVVKGKTESIDIYQPVELLSQFNEILLEKYSDGIKLYYEREFDKAINYFKDLFEETGDYISYLYIGRCEKHIKESPPPGWDGTEKFSFK